MVYVKLTGLQINTLKNLPNNLNNTLSSSSIGGLLVLNKKCEVKQIIMDFQSSSLEEFYIGKLNKKVHLFEHIKNTDPRNNFAMTFEISNILNNRDTQSPYNCYSVPGIYQWIKCIIHSLYRNIFTHLIFTASELVYVVSIKKNFYYNLSELKIKKKYKMKNMLHYLINFMIDIYSKNDNSILIIPDEITKYFYINKFSKSGGITFEYINYNNHIL